MFIPLYRAEVFFRIFFFSIFHHTVFETWLSEAPESGADTVREVGPPTLADRDRTRVDIFRVDLRESVFRISDLETPGRLGRATRSWPPFWFFDCRAKTTYSRVLKTDLRILENYL